MFKIFDGRDSFYQWDINQRLLVEDETIQEVHFCNKTDDEALVCEVYTEDGKRVVNVPNILLQDNWDVCVYAFCGYTKYSSRFKIKARSKPADYVYTETELWSAEKAVAEALEAAKASGDFKGDKGDKGDAGSIEFKVVTELPESDDGSTMYLVPTGASGEDNAYDEFIYNNGAWEKIGSTSVEANLDDYVKNSDYATATKAGVVRANYLNGVGVDNGHLFIYKAENNSILQRISNCPIVPSNLDYAVKTGVTTNTIPLTEEEKVAAQNWLGVCGGLKDFELLCDTTITEDVAEVKWSNTDSGEPISNYKDFFIYFLGSFTATENGGALYCRSNTGSNYHMWNTISKSTNTKGFWLLIESLFKTDEIDCSVNNSNYNGTQIYKSTYPSSLLGNVNEGMLITQGLSDNNWNVYSDVCIAGSNNSIYELYIGQRSGGAIFAAGSRFLLLGRKA